jgi:4-hydroxybutyrate dehydrogenase/sulfolactaldehyde 3-reductase
MVSCANAAVLAEAYALARRAGVDWGILTQVMSGTAADSWQLRNTVIGKALKGDFQPAFKLALAHKDMSLALEMATFFSSENGCTRSALEWYERAAAAGLSELDRAALLLLSDPKLKDSKPPATHG